MSTYRIVVCLNVEAKTGLEAYEKLTVAMPALVPHGIDWESTDEWYDAEGEPLSEEAILHARETVLAKRRGGWDPSKEG